MSAPEFSVSLMCMDLLRAGEQVEALNPNANYYHIDIMDGHFAPNLALSPDMVKALSSKATIPMEAHLMTTDPEQWLDPLTEAGISTLSVHAETVNRNAFRILNSIDARNLKSGVVLNPATALSEALPYLDRVDLLTIMTVDVGYAGQPFIHQMLSKIEQAAKFKSDEGLDFKLQIDGSCNANLDPDLGTAWKIMQQQFEQATGVTL